MDEKIQKLIEDEIGSGVYTFQLSGDAWSGRKLRLVQWSHIPRDGFIADVDDGTRMTNEVRAQIKATPLYRRTVMYDKIEEVEPVIEALQQKAASVESVDHYEHKDGRKDLATACKQRAQK